MPNAMHNKRQDMLEDTSPNEYAQSYHLIYDKDHILDARWHGNLFRHLNHSCRPNCIAVKRHAYGIQVILIMAKRHLAKGEECTLNYGSMKPEPCKCAHCLITHTLNDEHYTHSTPVRTDMLETDANDDHADLADCNNAFKTVNKKRSKYVVTYASSVGRILSLLLVLLARTPLVLPTCFSTPRHSPFTHPAHKFTEASFRGCIAGDGPSSSSSIFNLNPMAKEYVPVRSLNLDSSMQPKHPLPCSYKKVRSPHPQRRHATGQRAGRTPCKSPMTSALPAPVPHITTQTLWRNISPVLYESTFMQFSDSFSDLALTHSCSPTGTHDLRVAYLNIRTLIPEKHFFIAAFIHRYQLDVLFLIDTRTHNIEQSKHMLRSCLGQSYSILHSSPIKQSPGGQTIIIAPSWSGAFQAFWQDPSGLGCLTEVTLRCGMQNVKLYGAYWPCANSAPHSFETTLTSQLPQSTHYSDWRS